MVIEYFLEWVETASVVKRTEAASALVRAYLRKDISVEEKEDVEAALTTLLEDPAPGVRIALAEAFGARKSAPRHIISALSEDVIDVAVITLSQSPVLHDAELSELLKTTQVENQIAISCRPWMSDALVNSIASHGCEEACIALLMNPVANFTQDSLHIITQRFGKNTQVRLLLLEQGNLAAETRLILINKVGEALSDLVSAKGWLTKPRLDKVVGEACDKASITFVANASNEDVKYLVSSMLQNDRITVKYLLRAVCMGNVSLVANAFSQLSGVKLSRVETILTKDHKSAFKALYDRAGLPQTAFMIFHSAISSWQRVLQNNKEVHPSRLAYLVIREVLETYSGHKDIVVDELIVLLRKLSAEMARESSRAKAVEIASRSAEAELVVEILPDVVEVIDVAHLDEIELANEVDQPKIDVDQLIVNLEDDLKNFESEFDLEEHSSAANDEEVVTMPEVFAYDGHTLIEDDYLPDISEAIMNVATADASLSKAA